MISTPEDLQTLIDRARQHPVVAVDTEFVWERTYYPRLGLVQLGLGADDVHLIDAPALPDLAPLGALMADPAVRKLLHDASQDLQILTRATGHLPANVYDTQRAAGFVGLSATTSLQDLVEWATGTRLDKGETRTDWLQRPLTARQLDYAADDVRYMPAVYDRLAAEADARGRSAWIDEEMARYLDPALYETADVRDAVDRLKVAGIARLSPRQRAVLRALAAWRETEARRMDRTRRMVLPDEALLDLALRSPRTPDELARLRLTTHQQERYGAGLLRAIDEGSEAPPESVERRGRPGPEEERHAARLLVAQALLAGTCFREDMDATLVATKAELKAIAEAGPDAAADALPGWRGVFFGDHLRDLLSGRLAVRFDSEDGWPTASA
jgi:ribonuclease D